MKPFNRLVMRRHTLENGIYQVAVLAKTGLMYTMAIRATNMHSSFLTLIPSTFSECATVRRLLCKAAKMPVNPSICNFPGMPSTLQKMLRKRHWRNIKTKDAIKRTLGNLRSQKTWITASDASYKRWISWNSLITPT